MGQRHQLFIIAKVSTRYRVLAAVHHQWLYGFMAVRQALQTINLLRAEGNQAHIRRKLHQASHRWPDKKAIKEDSQAVEFPFLTTCLWLGASLDEHGDFAPSCQILPLPINTMYDAITNDDGVSVYDITSPSHIRNAFLMLAEDPAGDPFMDAQEYYNSSRGENGDDSQFDKIWEQMSELDIIDAAALQNA